MKNTVSDKIQNFHERRTARIDQFFLQPTTARPRRRVQVSLLFFSGNAFLVSLYAHHPCPIAKYRVQNAVFMSLVANGFSVSTRVCFRHNPVRLVSSVGLKYQHCLLCWVQELSRRKRDRDQRRKGETKMFRIAGRAAYQICRRETGATAQFVKTTITPAGSALRSTVDCWRGFSAPSGGGEGESRLVDVSTKEQFVDFPRYCTAMPVLSVDRTT